MSGRQIRAFSQSIASAISLSSAIDLQQAYNKISLVIPSMASGTDIQVHASDSLSGTYRQIFHQPTVTSATVSFVIASSVSNCIVPLPNVHAQYLKLRHTTATTDTSYDYKLICSD